MVGPDDYRFGQAAADLLVVAAVPGVLAAVHWFVPSAVQTAYVLYPESYTPLTLFTAAFLHASWLHLAGNVVGYTVAVGAAYLLCLVLAERRWFLLTTVVLVLSLPILVNRTALLVLGGYFGEWSMSIRGFSGVVAGFGGFTFAALLAYVGRRTDRWTAFFAGLAVTLLLLLEILGVYADDLPPVSTGLVALGVVLCGLEIGRRGLRGGTPASRADWRGLGSTAGVFLWTLAVLFVFVRMLFPAEVVADGLYVNVYAHAIGFLYGFVVAGWGYRYWRTTDAR